MTRVRRAPNSCRTAFTLVELTLALVLASIVGLSIVFMLASLGTAAKAQGERRQAVVERPIIAVRLGAVLRESAKVLDTSPERLVLWKADTNADGVPNLSELRFLKFRQDMGEVWLYQAPSPLPPGSDTAYAPDADFISIVGAIAGSATFPGEPLLAAITACEWTLDQADPTASRTLSVRVTGDPDTGPESTTVVASLRCTPD